MQNPAQIGPQVAPIQRCITRANVLHYPHSGPASETHEVPEQALYLKWRPARFEDVIGQVYIRLGNPYHFDKLTKNCQ